jgi:transcriptional regulator GlxA family with amidase domain
VSSRVRQGRAGAPAVLATRLARELDVGDWGTPEARRRALFTTVQAFIQQRLADADLSPAMVAAANHISLRSLHQLFHDEGLTVAGWTRRQRLERCRRDLADPGLASRPVAAIAARCGFSSAGDFSRAFRAEHGLPPAAYRSSALVVKPSALWAGDGRSLFLHACRMANHAGKHGRYGR